jgi:hypothetical protein
MAGQRFRIRNFVVAAACRSTAYQKLGHDPPMAKREARGGRPSKGPRDLMVTRLSLTDGEQVRALAAELDWSYSDTLAALVRIGLSRRGELPPAAANTQGELPLTKAS